MVIIHGEIFQDTHFQFRTMTITNHANPFVDRKISISLFVCDSPTITSNE